jgi:uncharacterized membrane protein YhaH (DUF805 family)
MDLQYIFTSFDGRINRAKWWAGAAILLIVWKVIDAILGASTIGSVIVVLVTLALFYPAYAVCAKRFQDRDRPGKTALYGLVPLTIAALLETFGWTGTLDESNGLGWICNLIYIGVALWFVIELGILRGTPGQNHYGGDPLAAIS